MTTKVSTDFKYRPMTEEEYKFSFIQPSSVAKKAGNIGHLDLTVSDDARGLKYKWFEHCFYWEHEVINKEIEIMMDKLRTNEYGEVLGKVECMKSFFEDKPEAKINGEYCMRYDSMDYTYLFRFNPESNDEQNAHCFIYRTPWFEKHIYEARQGIKFYTSDYKEAFIVADGGKIKEIYSDGYTKEQVVRFYTDLAFNVEHMLYDNNLTHTFIRNMERKGVRVEPDEKSLIKDFRGTERKPFMIDPEDKAVR